MQTLIIEKQMKNNPYVSAKFLKSASLVTQLPEDSGYEVAFAGRSNAGKSSALNTLTNIKNLARTSKTPGRTQLINVFTLGDDETKRLIDLPGYGYAKVSRKTKNDWQKNLAHYLEVRQSLKGLVLLMDIRHPLKDVDCFMIDWALRGNLPVHILLTKADKLSFSQAKAKLLQVLQAYKDFKHMVTAQTFSSLKKAGVDDLVLIINKWLEMP